MTLGEVRLFIREVQTDMQMFGAVAAGVDAFTRLARAIGSAIYEEAGTTPEETPEFADNIELGPKATVVFNQLKAWRKAVERLRPGDE